MRARRTVQIVNRTGLHARPCGAIVSLALEYQAVLSIRHGAQEVDGKSILHLMTLGAAHGAELELEAEGEDAEQLLESLVELIGSGFEEA